MGIKKDKLSEEQKKEVERLRNYVARHRLVPRMSSTKWRAAIDAITGVDGYRARYRCKRLEMPEPGEQWSEGLEGGLPLYNSIEWLELNPMQVVPGGIGFKDRKRDFKPALLSVLAAARIPVEERDGLLRIQAYSKA